MNKSVVDFIVKELTLLTIFAYLTWIYIAGRDSAYILVGAVTAGVFLAFYSFLGYRRFHHPEPPAKKNDRGHIRPRVPREDGNSSLRSVQVSRSVLDKIRIGKDYYYGRGLPKDFNLAFNFLFDGALAGDAEAQMLVGKMFQYGQGVGQNLSNAITWLEAASFQGNTEAEYHLGRIFAQDTDNGVSLLKAHYFLQNAASRGNGEAAVRLKELRKRHPLKAPITNLDAENFFEEHNPFIRAICADQLEHEPVPQYTMDDVKKCFKFFGISPTLDLDKVHHQYMSFMIKCHPDRRGGRTSSKKILMVRRAYDILEHYILSRQEKRPN